MYKLESMDPLSSSSLEAIIDTTFSEFVKLGKIDTLHNTIIPRPNLLQTFTFNGNQTTPILLNPVTAVQLKALLDNLSKCIMKGDIPSTSFINRLIPNQGYVNPLNEYQTYLNTLVNVFNKNRLTRKRKQVMTFNDYLIIFIEYMRKVAPNNPCTLTGWMKTKHSNQFSSGMFVNLLQMSRENDSDKEQILLDNTFTNFVHACKQFGFNVLKHSPNIIVTDLKSPATRRYLAETGTFNPDAFFRKYFVKTYSFDVQFLLNTLFTKYNEFYNRNRDKREFHFSKNGCMISKLYPREKNTSLNINNNINYIRYYMIIRNIEENNYLNDADLNELIENMIFFSSKVDNDKLMDYINRTYKVNDAIKDGSASYFEKRRLDDFSDT